MATDMSQFFQSLPEDTDADAEHEKYIMASALRSIGVEPFPDMSADRPGSDLQPAELPDEPVDRGPAVDVTGVGEDIGKAVLKGVDAAGDELLNSAAFLAGLPVEAANTALNVGREAIGMEPIEGAFGDIESLKGMVGVYQNTVNDVLPMPDAISDWASQPYNNQMLGELTQGITQFSVAAFPAAKMVKAMTTYNPIARGFIWGAIADFTAFNPDDPTITNAITEHLQMAPREEREPVLQMFLAQIEKYEDDPELVKRAKTALEGAMLGGAIEGIGVVVRGAVNIAKKIPFDQVISSARGALDSAGQAADQRIAERAGGTTLTAGADPMPAVDAAISAAGRAVRPAKNVDEARAAYEVSPNDPVLKQQYLDLRRVRDTELSQMSPTEQLELDTNYRMDHQPRGPQDGGGRLDDITAGGELFPDDVYSADGLRLYGNPNNSYDQQSHEAILASRGNPEAEITIYRGVPKDVGQINAGDWVTLSPDYAAMHAAGGYGPDGNDAGKVISQRVKVKDVFSDGNDLNEFGYFPADLAELGVKKIVPPTEAEPGIIAFHGSGADFDEFRLEMIGTGEGAQAYGYGLYFTDSEDIAKFYKTSVSGNYATAQTLMFDEIAQVLKGKIKLTDNIVLDIISKKTPVASLPQETQNQIKEILQKKYEEELKKRSGKMYKVGLSPKPDDMLDYQTQFKDQPQSVQDAIKKLGFNPDVRFEITETGSGRFTVFSVDSLGREKRQDFIDGYAGKTAKEQAEEYAAEQSEKMTKMPMPIILDDLQTIIAQEPRQSGAPFKKSDAAKILSERLLAEGVPGIKYRAAGSRAANIDAADAEMNYVIFDDKAVKILEKYGIAGPVLVTGAAVGASKAGNDNEDGGSILPDAGIM